MPLSQDYQAAIRAHDEACAAYPAAVANYRAHRIGDAEYLAAREGLRKTTVAFDAAFAAESRRPERAGA